MAFAGLRGTGDWGTDERPKSFRELILWQNPNGLAPLFALMSKMKKESVNDPEFSWFQEDNDIVRLQLNDATDMAAGDTTVVVDSGALKLVAGDVLQVEPATEVASYTATEIIIVTSVTNDTTFVVERGAMNTTAAAILDDAYFTRIGSIFEEGSGSANISNKNPTKSLNYTQIFKTTIGITGTADATKARTGNAWKNDKMRKAFEHSEKIEQAFFWGKAYEDTSGSKPKRSTGGLREFLTTHQRVYTSSPTLTDFLSHIHGVFDFDGGGAGNERLMFCGNGFLNTLNAKIANNSSTRFDYQNTIKLWGLECMKLVTPQGTFAIKSHPLFNRHARYTNSAFILNPKGLIYRPLEGRDTKFMDNIQANDEDTRKAQWLTECGLELQHENTMMYIGNFQ